MNAEQRELQAADHSQHRPESEPVLLAPRVEQRHSRDESLEQEPRVRDPGAVRGFGRDDRDRGGCEREVRVEPLELPHGRDPSRG